ncbi:uncharacterized protein LOC117179847 [Belonocnema kinseyi]|uniref:uncharacterized protein LOC117179847 n=1 Tax=Belonocnema kinseyi TaxID=2817044 RepID=UPI00143CC139|nr:uncharacterized protein LOC117179847 [Belonocnema kinseyi]
MTEEDFSEKCDKVNDKTRWDKVLTDLLNVQTVANSLIADVEKEAKKSEKATDDVYNELFKTHCLDNVAFKTAKTNVIKTASPCVTENRLAEILKYSMSYSCDKYKKEAMDKNRSGKKHGKKTKDNI